MKIKLLELLPFKMSIVNLKSLPQTVTIRDGSMCSDRADLLSLLSTPSTAVTGAERRLELGNHPGEEIHNSFYHMAKCCGLWMKSKQCFVIWFQGSEEGYLRKTTVKTVLTDSRQIWNHEGHRTSPCDEEGDQPVKHFANMLHANLTSRRTHHI